LYFEIIDKPAATGKPFAESAPARVAIGHRQFYIFDALPMVFELNLQASPAVTGDLCNLHKPGFTIPHYIARQLADSSHKANLVYVTEAHLDGYVTDAGACSYKIVVLCDVDAVSFRLMHDYPHP
jgi:hypothetical protein